MDRSGGSLFASGLEPGFSAETGRVDDEKVLADGGFFEELDLVGCCH